MPATGAKPGERRGGRTKGVPNKSVTEAALIAERTVAVARAKGVPIRKLAKEVLDEFMHTFAGLAAFYQVTPAGMGQQNRNQDPHLFQKYSELAIDCAKALAKYQSPQIRAHFVAPPGSLPGGPISRDQGAPSQPPVLDGTTGMPITNVVNISDPEMLARVYRTMINGKRG